MATKENSVQLSVRAEVVADASQAARPRLAAYAYSAGGALLDKGSVDDKGNTTLQLPAVADATSVRVLIGPIVENADLSELVRRGARETHLRLGPQDRKLTASLSILPSSWLCWLRSACVVKGTLLKRTESGGVSIDLPVCHATVDVYEVDPLYIILPRLPRFDLERIRDIIVGPFPIPEQVIPHPLPDPAPFDRVTLHQVAEQKSIAPQALKALQSSSSWESLRLAAQTSSVEQLSRILADYPLVVRPLLCSLFPYLVTMQKVATAVTDDCGHFQALFFNGCNNPDRPDLYFKAHQKLFGFFDLTIYAPTPIACHTHWNYACGTEVTLITTNPFAITCSPCPPVIGPNHWVLFTAIGNHSVNGIYGGGVAGANLSNWGLTSGGAPWGGELRPRLDFDNSLREQLGVKYYQLSWRKGTSGGWTPLTAEVFRHYAHVVGGDLVIEPYRLGPNYMVVGGQNLALFEIPPAVPPVGQWTVANAVLDTQNGVFPSADHSKGLQFNVDGSVVPDTLDESGLYQLKLDLYDAAGNLINIASKGIKYVVPDTTNLSGTIHTVNASTIAQPGGGSLVVGDSMVLTLHVDNNHCWAGIAPVTTPSGASDPCCGVVPYAPGASVTMPYTAYHPHGFASYSLRIYRSATQIMPTITGSAGSYSVVQTVANMMSLALPATCIGKPPCTTAAFAENLYVDSQATNGWTNELGYDALANRAFALSPV